MGTGNLQLAAAFRLSDSLVLVLDGTDAGIVDVNPAAERVLGWPRGELIGKRPVDLGLWLAPQARAQVWARLRSEYRIVDEPVRLACRDGSVFDAMLQAELFEADSHVYILAILHGAATPAADPASDVRSYRSLFLAASEGIYRSLPEGGMIDVNPAMARIFGYDSADQMLREFPRLTRRLYVDEGHCDRIYADLDANGQITNERALVYRRDGSTFWVSENARSVRDAAGRLLFFEGSMIDITDQVTAESALRQSEALYRILVDNCRDGVFLIQRGRVVFTNGAMAAMLGYPVDELIGCEYMQLVAPESRDAQERRRSERESGSRVAQGYEIVMLRKDGARRLVEVRADPVEFDGDIASTGTARDVTDERASRLALAEAERKYRQLFEHSVVGLFQTHPDGRILEANPALSRMLGYASPADLIASVGHMREVYADPADRGRLIGRILAEGGFRDEEIRIRRKDAGELWVALNAHAVRDPDGVLQSLEGSVQDVTAKRDFERELERNATHDALTRLPNRVLFDRAVAARLADAAATGRYDYAMLFLDLDGFKLVNDSLGHAAGDRLLVAIAARLSGSLGGDGMLARYGGDEFTVLPAGECTAQEVELLASRLLGALTEPFEVDGHRIYTGASLGIVLGRPAYGTPEQVLRDADTAMYRAKARGKSGYVVFDEAMHGETRARFALETDLRQAFERREFDVYYQPLVDLRSGALVGCEALLRWRHPRRGVLLPVDFLVVAEETGMIVPIDWWVLERACADLAHWRRRYPSFSHLRMNVNVDDRQFSERSIASGVGDVLARTGLAPEALALEVTETVFRAGRAKAQSILREVKALGVSLVVDDFGTGYSSLDSFASSPFDALKIDRSFVTDMESNRRHRAIVRTISAFAEDLGLALTAEGVESNGQAELLLAMGVTTAQGFLYAPALPATEMELVIAEGAALRRRA